MYSNLAAALGLAALSAMGKRTPEEIEARRRADDERRAERERIEAGRHPATRSKPRSAALERMLGKRK
jgi:hypothetical protein